MKTDKKTLFVLAASLLALTGCSDSISRTNEDAGAPSGRILIQGTIEQVCLTRVNDSGFADGDAIGVYVVNYHNDQAVELQASGNHATNVKFTFDGTENIWKSNTALYWTDRTTRADAYSYYPFVPRIEDVSSYSFSVSTRQQTETTADALGGYEGSDFLWAKAEGVTPGNTIFLSHKHILSSLQLSLVEGEGFDGKWEELEKSVTVENTVTDCNIDLRSGQATVAGDTAPAAITPLRYNNDYRCIVVPQTVAAQTPLISITLDGETYHFTRPVATVFQPGKLHKVSIRVDCRVKGDYTFTLIGESVTAWENDPVSHDGVSRSYITVQVPEAGGLQHAIDQAGLNYTSIKNLKLIGTLTEQDFEFIHYHLTRLEALNLKEVRTVSCNYGGNLEDDVIPNCAFCPPEFFDSAAVGFENMKTLKNIVFPEKLRKIGGAAFCGTGLSQKLEFPEGLTHIGAYAFYNHGSPIYNLMGGISTITGINLPSTLQHIGDYAFEGVNIKQELILPENIQYIGVGAFKDCMELTGALHLPQSLSIIPMEAFSGVKGMTGILEIPASIQEIGYRAFYESGFSGLSLNEGLKAIRREAFAGFDVSDFLDEEIYKWKEFSIPFRGDLVIPSTVTVLGAGAFAFTGFSHVYVPDNFEEWSYSLFMGCPELTDTVTVPRKVNNLQARVFESCSKLNAVVLPEGLLSIHDRCFAYCSNLNYIECKSKEPPALIGRGHFDGVAKDNFTLVVPKGCVDAYRNAPGWGEFKRIAEYSGFVCRPQFACLLNKSNRREVVLNADGAWTVTHQPTWAHPSVTSGSQTTTLTITIDALRSGAGTRTDSIVFSLTGTGHTATYRIDQYDSSYDEDQCVTLQSASRGKGINLVFMGDGYDAKDIAEGTYLADIKQSVEYFFDIEPYKSYREYFTVHIPIAMSYESGIGTLNTLRHAKFETLMRTGGCGVRMTSNFDKALLYAIDYTPVNKEEMDGLTVAVIPNTTLYDGLTALYTGAYGEGPAVAVCPKSALAYPYDARGIVQHEAGGHGFGKLADEYIYHAAWIQTCICDDGCGHVAELEADHAAGWGLNISLQGSRKEVPWAHLISDSRVNDLVDIYEGGYFHSRGVYRSEQNSCMNENIPYYSTWCRQLIVQRIKRLAGEAFDYEEFMAKDCREWGKDFTTGTRGSSLHIAGEPLRGQTPVIKKALPKRLQTH